MEQVKNYGLKLGKRQGDYIAGRGYGYTLIEMVPNKNWKPYLSFSEKQSGLYFDTMACVTFSAMNCLEAIFNYRLAKKMINEEDLAWLTSKGYIVNDKFNFSDRFTAKMSGTTRDGNWLYLVGDSVRNDGLVPEALYPYPREQRTPVFDWNDYYKTIPADLIELGKEFAERFQIYYEWVVGTWNFVKELPKGPLQVTVHAWDNPVDGVYQRSSGSLNHAVSLVNEEQYRELEDQYDPHIKKIAGNFILGESALRYIVVTKLPTKKIDMIKLYSTKETNTVYELWADGLYHPIAHESYVINKYGGWGNVTVEQLESILATKVGSTIGEYSWIVQALINFLSGLTKLKGKIYAKK